jgi:iron complex outermembrane receptor protein
MDGIPVYVPYDGYVDLDRFTTFDLAEVQVSKGFTSPLYGPNAIGGAINLVSKAPTEPLQLDLGFGYGSGREFSGYANVGSRLDRFWLQGGISALDSDFTPLSGDFTLNALQPTRQRVNAYRQDVKGSFKVAFTPHGSDQYVFSYLNQQGEKGNPPYAGGDSSVAVRYWQWPQWDKEGFYFSANKGLGETSYLRARLYYDKFDNYLRSFDDATYSTQTRGYAFDSPYDDDTYGTILELGTGALPLQTVKGSFYYKDDTHREGNIGEPMRSFRDQSFSWGFEDTVRITGRASAIVGFSADYLTVRNAEDLQGGLVAPVPVNSVWAFNAQAATFYSLSSSDRLHASFARKTRLPTIKDRYSYRMGRAIPNPDLARELSNNYEVGYSHFFGATTTVDFVLFRSDIMDSVQAVFVQPNVFQFQNVGEARHMGAEFSARSQLLPSVGLTANYTYLNRENRSAPTIIPVDTPRHKTYGALTWRPFSRLQLLGDLRYEAGRYGNNPAGTVFLAPQYADMGLHTTADLGKGVQLQGGVTNLLDRNYFLIEGYPEPGRAGYVNLRYRF